jgi:diaminohydroxyphosphoribosylaminopyrimidine deaminase/5-amino-6-(5-phosphoribosylamino)uracil reductase
LGALGLDRLGDAPRFDLLESRLIGGDLYHRWRRQTQA